MIAATNIDQYICTFGSSPMTIAPSIVTNSDTGIIIIMTDIILTPCPTCTSTSHPMFKPPIITKPPCIPLMAGTWLLASTSTSVNGIPVVTAQSQLNCAIGKGVIKAVPARAVTATIAA